MASMRALSSPIRLPSHPAQRQQPLMEDAARGRQVRFPAAPVRRQPNASVQVCGRSGIAPPGDSSGPARTPAAYVGPPLPSEPGWARADCPQPTPEPVTPNALPEPPCCTGIPGPPELPEDGVSSHIRYTRGSWGMATGNIGWACRFRFSLVKRFATRRKVC